MTFNNMYSFIIINHDILIIVTKKLNPAITKFSYKQVYIILIYNQFIILIAFICID